MKVWSYGLNFKGVIQGCGTHVLIYRQQFKKTKFEQERDQYRK